MAAVEVTEIVLETEDAINRIVESLRVRLLEARRHGQPVRMSARESGSTTMSARDFERQPLRDTIARIQPQRFEMHIYIGDER